MIGLASGLSQLEGDDEYLFLTASGHQSWLLPYIDGCSRVIPARKDNGTNAAIAYLKRQVRRTAPAVSQLRRLAEPTLRVPRSDGTAESHGADVMHLTAQEGFLTEIPSIYHPHDLQHVHLPQYFPPHVVARRELYYRTLCARATVVAVSSTWTKDDLIAHYGLPAEKIQVIPLAPLLSEYPAPTPDDIARTQATYRLPEQFAFYPAQTWPHKNHMMLLDALAHLKREGLLISFVSSGHKTEHYVEIADRARRLGIDDQVHFLGFVSPLELQCLYRLSRCVVLPTRFEAGSFPLWEAFLAGTPAACSTVTSLPRQAGDAALLFDPDSAEEIANALRSLWEDERLRDTLIERGYRNVSQLSWTRTARAFRALYRKTAGRELTAVERDLLTAAETML